MALTNMDKRRPNLVSKKREEEEEEEKKKRRRGEAKPKRYGTLDFCMELLNLSMDLWFV